MCTLADLDAYLALQHKVSCYSDLCMGPLLVHELVVANFRPPAHVVEVPQVWALDIAMTPPPLLLNWARVMPDRPFTSCIITCPSCTQS